MQVLRKDVQVVLFEDDVCSYNDTEEFMCALKGRFDFMQGDSTVLLAGHCNIRINTHTTAIYG